MKKELVMIKVLLESNDETLIRNSCTKIINTLKSKQHNKVKAHAIMVRSNGQRLSPTSTYEAGDMELPSKEFLIRGDNRYCSYWDIMIAQI